MRFAVPEPEHDVGDERQRRDRADQHIDRVQVVVGAAAPPHPHPQEDSQRHAQGQTKQDARGGDGEGALQRDPLLEQGADVIARVVMVLGVDVLLGDGRGARAHHELGEGDDDLLGGRDDVGAEEVGVGDRGVREDHRRERRKADQQPL